MLSHQDGVSSAALIRSNAARRLCRWNRGPLRANANACLGFEDHNWGSILLLLWKWPCVCLPPTSAVGLLLTVSRNIEEPGVESDAPQSEEALHQSNRALWNPFYFSPNSVFSVWIFLDSVFFHLNFSGLLFKWLN